MAMDTFKAVAIAEERQEAWQYLHTSGVAYQLQGWFGREAQRLLAAGVIHDE